MEYSKLFKRAFDVVRHEPALWIVGVIMAIFGGAGGGSGSFNPFVNWNPTANMDQELVNELQFDQLLAELPAWFNFDTLFTVGLLIVTLIIVWSLLAFAIRNVALAGLIYGSERASVGQDVRWGELLRFGWSRHALRLMGLNFLLALPALLMMGLILIVVGIMFFTLFETFNLAEGHPPNFEGLGAFLGSFALIFCLGIFVGLLTWILSLIGHYASRFIVLDGHSIMDGFRKGWQLLKNNVGDTIITAILLIVLSFIIGIIISIIFIVLGLLVAIPFIFLITSESASLMSIVILAIVAIIFITFLVSLLYGPLLAYIQTVWTLLWLELTQDGADEVELNEAMI